MIRILRTLSQCLRSITVEPVAFMFMGAFMIVSMSGISSMYYKICMNEYSHVNCKNLSEFPTEQTEIQSKATEWNMYITLAYTICAIPATLIMSAWGDLEGRKINMLISFAGVSLLVFAYIVEISLISSPLWVLVLVSAIVGCTGLLGLMGTSIFQYITDVVEDRDSLVVRMTICGTAIGVGSIISGSLGGFLMGTVGFAWTFVAGEVMIILGTLYTLIFIKMKPSAAVQKMQLSKTNSVKLGIFDYVRKLLSDVYLCYTKKRQGRYRAYIFVTVAAVFLYTTVEMGLNNLIILYAFNPPLSLSPSLVSYVTASSMAFGMVASMASVYLTKYLKWTDTSVVLLSFASALTRFIALGLSRSNWIYIASYFLGCLQQIGFAATQAFAAKLVEAQETGKIIAGLQITNSVASVAASVVYNGIYNATLKVYAGTVFFVAAAIVLVSMAIVLWMHIDYKLYKKNHPENAEGELEIQKQDSSSSSAASTSNGSLERNNR